MNLYLVSYPMKNRAGWPLVVDDAGLPWELMNLRADGDGKWTAVWHVDDGDTTLEKYLENGSVKTATLVAESLLWDLVIDEAGYVLFDPAKGDHVMDLRRLWMGAKNRSWMFVDPISRKKLGNDEFKLFMPLEVTE